MGWLDGMGWQFLAWFFRFSCECRPGYGGDECEYIRDICVAKGDYYCLVFLSHLSVVTLPFCRSSFVSAGFLAKKQLTEPFNGSSIAGRLHLVAAEDQIWSSEVKRGNWAIR